MHLLFLIARWALAIGCIYFLFRVITRGFAIAEIGGADGMGAAVPLLGGFLLLITTVVLISPETVMRVCEWCSRLFASIIFPDDQFEKPPLSYLLARRYNQQMRYVEAIEEYVKILRYYPKEHDAYLELIAVCDLAGESRLSKKYLKRFGKHFSKE